MKKIIQDFKIIENKKISSDYFILKLLSKKKLAEILPGQFVQVLITNSKNTFLRRPFSINDVCYKENTISLFIKKKGEATKALSHLKQGDYLNIIYPLGNFFSLPSSDKVLLVGGGFGIAPLLYLSKYLYNQNIIPYILIGGQKENDILELDEFGKYGHVFVTTEDGSLGIKGLVTQHSVLKSDITTFKKIYTCGPNAMLKAVAKIAQNNNIDCEVSLENMMACGIGACLCCIVKTIRGNERVCTEGPVFNAFDLCW
jgi:dihydroorotate dehydrogenase electron transfer subunit